MVGDLLDVGDDEVARDQLHEPADDEPERAEARARLRAVEAAPEALQRLDRPTVVGVEAVWRASTTGGPAPPASRARAATRRRARRGRSRLRRRRRTAGGVARADCRTPRRAACCPARARRKRLPRWRDRTSLLPFTTMGNWGLYLLFLIPPLIIGFAVQAWLKRTVAANMQVEVVNGLTGAEVARQILDQNGLQGIPVEPSPGGPLSDHYDPRKKSVHLSEPVYAGRARSRRRSPRTRSGTRSSTRRPTRRSGRGRRCGRSSRSPRTRGSSC